ncbi:MAG: NADH-quinone oxidoreductase subunit A [Chloroflexi bacterium]|nr:NADH-quinone oxidoreductase subunit A [Chloroflexota bacterium]
MFEDYFRQYALIAVFALGAVALAVGMLLLSRLATFARIRPHKPDPVKSQLYECGVQPIGPARWTQFNFRYYMYALLFVIFDVETVFLYPWALRLQKLGLFALVEMLVFVLILAIGLAYAWRKRALEWE